MTAALTAGLAVAGAAGAVCRVLLDTAVRGRRPGVPLAVPTLLVNALGSLLLGVVAGLVLAHGLDPGARAVVGTGFCGGFTTFSTASWEVVALAERGAARSAVAAAVAHLLVPLAAAALGLALAGALGAGT